MSLSRTKIPLALAICLSLLNACSTGQKKSAEPAPTPAPQPTRQEPSPRLSPQEAAAYREIQALFSKGAFEPAIQKMIKFEKTYPNSPQIAHVRNMHGLSYMMMRKPLQAIYQIKRAYESSPSHGFKQYVLYNLAAAQTEAEQFEDAEVTLSQIDSSLLDRETQVKFHSLRGRLAHKTQNYFEAARQFLALSRLLDSLHLRGTFITQLDESLKSITDLALLENLYREFEDAPLIDLVLYRLGSQELASGKPGPGEAHLRDLVSRFPRSIHYADATDLLRSLESRKVVDKAAIGVLLPMKGKFERFGRRSLQAIELALRVFNSDRPNSDLTLVIEDSGEEPEQALKALNRLYFKHHVVAVIGPLLSKGVDQVTQRAQELGLPLIPLAQQLGVSGDYIFQSGLTPKMQAHEIARYAVQKLGLRKFAILHPRDRFGEQYSQSFWDALEEFGGEVVGIEAYQPGETDFRRVVDKLSGLYYADARKRELDELAKLREQDKITRRTRKTEHYFALKPVVDYQAVFIPDEPKVVGQILPTFAYRDVDQMKFLGISTWHSQELLSRAQSYANGAAFVDAFYAESQSKPVREFVDGYTETFGEQPGQIEALAYDAGLILERAVKSSNGTRDSVRDRLASISGFQGVTGRISFKDGQFLRDLNVLSIQNGKFVDVKDTTIR